MVTMGYPGQMRGVEVMGTWQQGAPLSHGNVLGSQSMQRKLLMKFNTHLSLKLLAAKIGEEFL